MNLPSRILMMVTRPDPRLADIVEGAVCGGANMVQLRHKEARDLTTEARALRERIGARALLVVNGHWTEEADGVHLPEAAPSVDLRGKLLGRSVHSVEHARHAESEGVHYIVAGTIFESSSHPEGPVAGIELLERICASVSLPVIAIGGITPENARRCIEAGASGVAVLSPLMNAIDPRATAAEYARAIA